MQYFVTTRYITAYKLKQKQQMYEAVIRLF